MKIAQAAELVAVFADADWDRGWKICKAHGKGKGLSKASIRQQRPGYVRMWLIDMWRDKQLTEAELMELNLV